MTTVKKVEIEPVSRKTLEEELAAIRAMTDTDELRSMLVQSLGATVAHFIRQGAVLRRLEELGIDLRDGDFEIVLLPWVRKVAYDQLLPELLVAYLGKLSRLYKLAILTKPEQQRIIADEGMRVMLIDGDVRTVPVSLLTRLEFNQVFGREGIRTDAAQITYLREQQERAVPKAPLPEVLLDRKRQQIHVTGAKVLTFADLAHYMELLSVQSAKRH